MSEKRAVLIALLVKATRENPIRADELEAALGLPPERNQTATRSLIAALNFAGVPAVSDHRGFWMATDWTDVAAYSASQERRALACLQRSQAVLRCRLDWQQREAA